MHKLDIYLTDEVVVRDEGVETFPGVADWDRRLYERHWARALRRLLEGASRSALITSYVEPGLADYLMWWPLYREGDSVYVQNHMLFYAQLAKPFSPEDPWESVPARRNVNAEGLRISEWVTDLASVRECLDRRGGLVSPD
jgi:CdiI N-terminal domain